ncbi:MAG TPA: hypothetical protein IAC02_12145, partial [Candidatus Coprovivens excrementavium]|nr:hypothetical protein [Candidatus Coprovivens excrementavium]
MKTNIKSTIICALITILIGLLVAMNFLTEKKYSLPTQIYQVYLDGNKIGLIDSKEELYSL